MIIFIKLIFLNVSIIKLFTTVKIMSHLTFCIGLLCIFGGYMIQVSSTVDDTYFVNNTNFAIEPSAFDDSYFGKCYAFTIPGVYENPPILEVVLPAIF